MLIFIRHGRTEANATGLLLGRLDPGLDDLGRRQAAALAQVVGNAVRVVSSPLARTRQTAEAVGLPVVVDDRFVELDYGDWDGRPLRDITAKDWATWRSDVTFAPPGGESLADLGERVRRACEELAEEAQDHDIIVVSHVSPIKAAVAWALGAGDDLAWRLFVAPASVTRIATGPASPRLISFNETDHLTDV